ncbi:MAG: hypothetical protein AB2L21_09730 [Anaerolineaceae bacterium]
MRKKLLVIGVLSVILLCSACSSPAETVEPNSVTSDQVETPVETSMQEPTEEMTQESIQESTQEATQESEAEELPQTIEEVVSAMLDNPQQLFGEGVEQMTENMGGQFSSIEVKQPAGEYFQFISEKDSAYISLNTRLKDFGGEGRSQQAFVMRFMPDPANNLSFTLIGMGEIVISFETDGAYCTYVQTGEKLPISDYTLEQGEWYNIFLATDKNAMLRVIIWKDGNYENQMFYERDLYIGADDIFESNWRIIIGFNSSSTLNVSEYSIYTFDKLTENPPVVSNNGDEEGSEAVESWSVKIGNFDAMSDGINYNVEAVELNIGSSLCTAYRLDALVAFANADGSSGAIVFFEDGSTENVPDLTNAFLVFMRDGQRLGKPFLGYKDTVYNTAVMEIRPN